MAKTFKLGQPFNGVAAGGVATCDLEIGPRYHTLVLKGTVKRTGVAPAMSDILGTIRLKVNGQTIREYGTIGGLVGSGVLDALNQQYGSIYAANVSGGSGGSGAPAAGDTCTFYLSIFLAEPWRKSMAATEFMAWPTLWENGAKLSSLQLEITVPSTANTSLHAIEVYTETDGGVGSVVNGAPVFNACHVKTGTWTYGAAGQANINTLEREGFYQEVHLFTTTDVVTEFEVEVSNSIRHKATKAINDHNLVMWGMNESNLSTTRLDIIFDRTDLPTDALYVGGASSFNVRPTISGGNSTVLSFVTEVFKSVLKR